MSYEVTTRKGEALQIAAVHDRATFGDLSQKIGKHVKTVLDAFSKSQQKFGRCVVIYWDDGGPQPLLGTAQGVPIDVGWEVEQPFAADPVTTVKTPAGKVATATHIGPYDRMGDAHRAIATWCMDHKLRLLGPNWEVYDHPRDGQPLRTDVYYSIG